MEKSTLASKVFKQNSGFVARKIAGELILIPVKKELREINSLYSTNSMTSTIWEKIDGKRSFQNICDEVLREYEVDQNALESDLKNLFGELESIQAIEAV